MLKARLTSLKGQMAEWADSMAASCNLDSLSKQKQQRRLFKSEFLVNTILISSMLRNESLLGEVAQRTVLAIAPAPVRLWLEQTGVNVCDMVPHFSTLSRGKLPFVAAYRLAWQDYWRTHEAGWYVQVDSSPQLGKDWLLCLITFVARAQLPLLHAGLQELYQLAEARHTACDVDAARRQELSSQLPTWIQTHTLNAGAVASGRSSLLHKLHALLHAFYIELGSWPAVFRQCGLGVSFTSDGGTESGLQRLRRKIVTEHSDEMLPWLQDPVSSVMEDVMAGCGEAAADAQPLPLEPDAPLANDLLFGSALLWFQEFSTYFTQQRMRSRMTWNASSRTWPTSESSSIFPTCLQAPEACRMHAESPLLKAR